MPIQPTRVWTAACATTSCSATRVSVLSLPISAEQGEPRKIAILLTLVMIKTSVLYGTKVFKIANASLCNIKGTYRYTIKKWLFYTYSVFIVAQFMFDKGSNYCFSTQNIFACIQELAKLRKCLTYLLINVCNESVYTFLIKPNLIIVKSIISVQFQIQSQRWAFTMINKTDKIENSF